jgi:hypothetical protein
VRDRILPATISVWNRNEKCKVFFLSFTACFLSRGPVVIVFRVDAQEASKHWAHFSRVLGGFALIGAERRSRGAMVAREEQQAIEVVYHRRLIPPPRNREVEMQKAKERSLKRFA